MNDDFQLQSSPKPNLSRKKKKRLKNTLNDNISNSNLSESNLSTIDVQNKLMEFERRLQNGNSNFLMKSLGLDGFVTVYCDNETEGVVNDSPETNEIDKIMKQNQIIDRQINSRKNESRFLEDIFNSNTSDSNKITKEKETIFKSNSIEVINRFPSDKDSELFSPRSVSSHSKKRNKKSIKSRFESQQRNELSITPEKISTEPACSSELQSNSSSIISGDSLRRLGTDEIKPMKEKKLKNETSIKSRLESEWLDELSIKSEKISTEPECSSELQSNSSSIISGDSLRRLGTDEIKPMKEKKLNTDIRSESDFDYNDTPSKKMENEVLKYLPEGKAKFLIISWNMAGISNCPEFLNELFQVDKETEMCDLFLLCFEETTNNKTELLIRIQSALGSDYVIYDQVENKKIFVVLVGHRQFIWNIKIIGKNILSTRITTVTKGVAAISFYFFGSSFLFLGSHFSSDMDKNDLRLEDYKSILYSKDLIESLTIPSMKLGHDENNISHFFDYTIWAGDLNFRINLEDSKVRNIINKEKSYYSGANIENLLENDELLNGQINGTMFQEFEEGRITFLPTYKFVIGKNEYHESRIPAYTDRILFRSHVTGGIDYLLYKPVTSFVCSDHKPIQSILEVSIARQENESFKSLGRFNNEIYEKYQSISSNNSTSQSRTCSIQ